MSFLKNKNLEIIKIKVYFLRINKIKINFKFWNYDIIEYLSGIIYTDFNSFKERTVENRKFN
jgi:hypothetical protein